MKYLAFNIVKGDKIITLNLQCKLLYKNEKITPTGPTEKKRDYMNKV